MDTEKKKKKTSVEYWQRLITETRDSTLIKSLGIEITYLNLDAVEGKMPVDPRTHQPAGMLHGGASVALAESLASIGANAHLDSEKFYGVGQEINANHIRSVRSGWVFGRAEPIYLGHTSQVWKIDIKEESGKLICISRCTIAVVNRRDE